MDMNFLEYERERLNRRLRHMDNPEVARKLKYYRARISKPMAIRARGKRSLWITREDGSQFLEGEDVIQLCHEYLDMQEIPKDYKSVTTESPWNRRAH